MDAHGRPRTSQGGPFELGRILEVIFGSQGRPETFQGHPCPLGVLGTSRTSEMEVRSLRPSRKDA